MSAPTGHGLIGRGTASAPAGNLLAVISEVALCLVHLAVVLGFTRVYAGTGFAGDLVVMVVAGTLLAVGTRRLRVPTVVALAATVVGAALVTTWLLFPDTLRLGLPTADSWSAVGAAAREARSGFEEVQAPAPALTGFQLVAGLALWSSVWFADWAAHRLRATVEAVVPAAVLFVVAGLLGSGEHQVLSAVAFAAAVLVFVAAHRALRSRHDQAWLASSPDTGPHAALRAGVALAAAGLVVGAVIGPRLPGSADEPLVPWRAGAVGAGDRTTVSPIVDLHSRLVDQSDTELFTVTASEPAYWRLTALDRFDGRIWSSSQSFSSASGDLAGESTGGRQIEQAFTITGLATIWAPAAFVPVELVDTSGPLRWDEVSGTLIVDSSEPTSDGFDYRVVSVTPDVDAEVLRTTDGGDPAPVVERFGGLPEAFPAAAATRAATVTEGLTTRYDRARALQDWFRSEFTYSLDVPTGHGDDAIVAFLSARRGYCEQFAGTYAAMARSLGIPARVAVGFTPGEVDPTDPDRYQVLGRHAHAWPEVWFPEVGWVPFEPTPSRGIPGAAGYTGVAEQQDEGDGAPPPAAGPTTTALEPRPTTTPEAPTTTTPAPETVAPATPGDRDDDGGGPGRWAVAALVLVLVGGSWVAAALTGPARRARRDVAGRPGELVLDAWQATLVPVRWFTGLRPAPSETPGEFARRAGTAGADRSLDELAALATAAAWNPAGATPADAARATEVASALRDQAWQRRSRPQRVAALLSWQAVRGQASGSASGSRRTRSRKRSEVDPR